MGDFNPSGRKFFKVIIPYFQMIDMASISFNAESMDARSRKLICVCLISITLVSFTLVRALLVSKAAASELKRAISALVERWSNAECVEGCSLGTQTY